MKFLLIISITIFCMSFSSVLSQNNFDISAYSQFLHDNQNLSFEELQTKFDAKNVYYKGVENAFRLNDYAYLDSIKIKFGLSDPEAELLKQNQFVVSERLGFESFGRAFHFIYINDLPVFISSDAILHALHASYDRILKDMEISLLKPNLAEILSALYSSFPQLINKYGNNDSLQNSLKDVDVYVTIAKSLLEGVELSPQLADQQRIDDLWTAIGDENLVMMPLFSERSRKLDFSQFTVRGHYNNDSLKHYFKAMMWLGRMDFLLTAPPENPWEEPWNREEIRRMNISAFMLNELLELSENREKLEQNDEIISFMVGESDNITPNELRDVISSQWLDSAAQMLDDDVYDAYLNALVESNGAEQKILSQVMMMDPFSAEPGDLPISFRLMGQRFIIDSYIFSNVVYDRIVFNGQKIWRPMPDPLDAMFVLGNDDALPLLKEELETYKYSSQVSALRYLTDSYDEAFWQSSLYNVWLNSIRALNPAANRDGFPLFMKTAAWRQCKLNTQLASWAQLRHDNLLYAKQSYTSATGCSFPYTLVEPNPVFFDRLADFADKAFNYFSGYPADSYEMEKIQYFFSEFKAVMYKLANIARKELQNQPLSDEEIYWLKEMLFVDGMSGAPPFSGWYPDLFYDQYDADIGGYTIADVHTQPTDENGGVVGNVLHVATGNVNLGIFLVESFGNPSKPIAFIGPLMSYYEKTTSNFKRLNDQEWTKMVEAYDIPPRPDWVNIYLADFDGNKFDSGRELPSVIYSGIEEPGLGVEEFFLSQNYPNPFNPITTIVYRLSTAANVELSIYNLIGQRVATLVSANQAAGNYKVRWNAAGFASGIYLYKLKTDNGFIQSKKLILLK